MGVCISLDVTNLVAIALMFPGINCVANTNNEICHTHHTSELKKH